VLRQALAASAIASEALLQQPETHALNGCQVVTIYLISDPDMEIEFYQYLYEKVDFILFEKSSLPPTLDLTRALDITLTRSNFLRSLLWPNFPYLVLIIRNVQFGT
jgi:hypothetical protein